MQVRLRPPWAHPGAWHLESVARDGGGNDNIFFFFLSVGQNGSCGGFPVAHDRITSDRTTS